MRKKSLCGGRRAPSAPPPAPPQPSLRTIPLLANHTQDEYNAAVFETSAESESDDDLRDVRMACSDENMADCIDQHSNRSPQDVSNNEFHDYIDLLDKTICISCNKGGGVLVCSERGCPVTLHAKCICSEPKFDDLGKFYCPYCWYKQAVEKSQELRKKAVIAKKALSNFLDKNVVTRDKLVQKDESAKRKEPLEGDGISLDGNNWQGTDGVHRQALQTEGDQPTKMSKAATDQYEIALEDQADEDGDFIPCREEEIPVHDKLVQDSMNWEKFDKPNISETHATIFVEGKGSFETEDPRHNKEDVCAKIVEDGEEAEPLSASNLGKYTDGHSPDIAFAKGTQESVAKSSENKGRMKDRGKVLQRETKVSATGSSVSETIDSDSEALSVKKGHVKRKVQKTVYPQKVTSVRKPLLRERNTTGKNACYINEEITSSKTLRQSQRSPKQVKKQTLLTAKRKRLLWTAEEEKTLKEGVLRFSMENQNIPWRKILEFGSHVFDKTRTPVDLKDKWKNITTKEGCK